MKEYFKISTKTIVASAIGAALFTLLFLYVRIPSPIPNTSFHTAYGLAAFFGALFGPITSLITAFLGHALNDAVSGWGLWWSWIIASGVAGFVFGFAYKRTKVEEGSFSGRDILTFNLIQAVGHAIAWIVVAPVLDIVIYAEPVSLVFTQGVFAFITNTISTGIIGTLLLIAYSATRPKQGSLKMK